MAVSDPTVTLTVHFSKAVTLAIELLDSKGRKLAHWTEKGKPGRNTFVLRLPKKARHPANDRLQLVSGSGKLMKTLGVTLRL